MEKAKERVNKRRARRASEERPAETARSRLRDDWRVVAIASVLLTLAVVTPVFYFFFVWEPPAPPTEEEQRCQEFVQGQIAWNYEGNKEWDPRALRRLCRGTKRALQPALCFDLVFHGRIDWGKGTRWRWEPAADLCAGTDNARGRVACFQKAVETGRPFRSAIESCQSVGTFAGRTTCDALVQGNVAWNKDGDTNWTQSQLELLCAQTSRPTQPLLCFDRLFHGKGPWNDIINGEWSRAAQLCSGTASANARISCIQTGSERTASEMTRETSERRRTRDTARLFDNVLKRCNPPEPAETDISCRAFVQGNIPWSGSDYRTWQDSVLQDLCANTRAPREPGLCFNRAMYGGIDLANKGLSKWAYAVALCAGTNDADARLDCYTRQRTAGEESLAAIEACKKKP